VPSLIFTGSRLLRREPVWRSLGGMVDIHSPEMQNTQETTQETQARRRVLIAGASGLVGGYLLQALLADATVAEVHALSRSPLRQTDPRLIVHFVDFAQLPELPVVDEVYLALGTTIKQAGSQAAFRAVDHDANLAVAKAALLAGATRIGLVSAMGADAASRVFYNRVKGELEEALAALDTQALVIARPSLLLGDRNALGQPARRGEAISQRIGAWIGALLPANYRPIEARKVAAALLTALPQARGRVVLLSGQMQ